MNFSTILAAVILLPSGADRTVRIAADEFSKYHRLVTGEGLVCVTQVPKGEDSVVRIGFPVDDAILRAGKDAYVVRSEGKGLVIAGSNSRSVLYGVYDFFRTRCGCAWFWDSDTIPKRPRIDFAGTDIREQAQFEYRGCQYFAHRGLQRFHAEQWGFDDWRREIDWCVKNRLNVFYMHFGSDDLFQLAFPDVVPYPDPARTTNIGQNIQGYNNRTPFWSMQFRNLLRKAVLAYARDRGMIHPEKIGPATHWFYRTPESFLETYKPAYLPQVETRYNDPTGLIWDIRDDRWYDAYWRLTDAAVREYGRPGMFFNCGFDERTVYSNRTENLKFKLATLKRFNDDSYRRDPEATVVMEGWDFYLTWKPEEVKELFTTLDPKRTIIWDFMADSVTPMYGDISQWGIAGKFPYTFGITLAHNRGMDIRGQYEVIRRNERKLANDPMCKGYVIWPEISHTDLFAWRYFTDNCWKLNPKGVDELLSDFCRDRYGEAAPAMYRAWKAVIPVSQAIGFWSYIGIASIADEMTEQLNNDGHWLGRQPNPKLAGAPAVHEALAAVKWEGANVRRDTIDIASTVLDRELQAAWRQMMKTYCLAKTGKATAADVRRDAERAVTLAEALADVLELHDDYSLSASMDRTDEIEKVRNPNFEHILFENSSCVYCRSHQYEYARGWYLPATRELAELLIARSAAKDFSKLAWTGDWTPRLRAMAHPIRAFAPDRSRRTAERFREIIRR